MTKEVPIIERPHALAVLRALQDDADRAGKKLAYELGMSASAYSSWVSKLKNSGLILGIHAVLDPQKLGFGALAFFEVELQSSVAISAVARACCECPEVEEAHLTGGRVVLLKVRARAMSDLADLRAKIGSIDGVQHVNVTVCLKTVKETRALAI